MDDETLPETQPGGMLVPPPRVPPAALATAAPVPPRPPRRHLPEPAQGFAAYRRRSLALLAEALDRLDVLGDRIAAAAGIR